jgi:hypothetical protein
MDPIFDFIIHSLEIAKAPYNIINNELILAQCRVDVPASFFRPARTELMNLQIVCHPELLSKYPGAELVTSGSFRLQWFADGIKQRGQVFRGAYDFDLDPAKVERQIVRLLDRPVNFFFRKPTLFYHPHLLVNFKATFTTDEKFDELHSLGINLVTGEIDSNLLQELQKVKISPHPPKRKPEKKKIPYNEGFSALENHLKWQLRNHDPQWTLEAKTRWEEEVQQLENFFQDNSGANEAGLSFYRQVAETYRKFRPVIRLQIVNAGIFYLPWVVFTLESREPGEELPPLQYDPVRRKIAFGSYE